MTRAMILGLILTLSGCAGGSLGDMFDGSLFDRNRDAPEGPVVTEPVIGEAEAQDIAPEDSDTRAAAVAEGDTAAGDAVRGFTVATLGDATIPGIWIETPLVERERVVTIVAPDGTTIQATARPSGGERGSGSRMSLDAFQALGLSLTDLPTVTVIAE